jgi:glycosyltransferase involved in cell wall biosynthesis
MKDKIVCFFVGDISKNGGTERVSTLIANGLNEKGFKVIILSYQNGSHSYYHLNDRIELFSLNMENVSGFFSRKLEPYRRLWKFISEMNIDIIVDVDVILSLYTTPIKKLMGVKVISWEHFNFYEKKVKTRVLARYLAIALSDSIVTLNSSDMDYYKNASPRFFKEKIRYIYNPKNKVQEKISNEKEKIVLAVGRLTHQKNFQEMLNIWSLTDTDDWKLIIVGSGEDESNLKEIIYEYNLSNVELISFTKNIDDFYSRASILVMTSRYEGLPMVLIEAQSFGLPLISYDCQTGPSDIINNDQNGFLIEYGNQKEFSNKLKTLIKSNTIRNKFSVQATHDSERFDLNKIICEWESLINHTLGRE